MQEAQRQAALAVHRVLDRRDAAGRARRSSRRPIDGAAGRRRALVQELAYGTLRHWGTLEALRRQARGQAVVRPSAPRASSPSRSTSSTTRARRLRRRRSRGRMRPRRSRARRRSRWSMRCCAAICANATRSTRAVRDDPVARWSYPRWWIGRVERDYPHDWQSILEAGNARPPLTLRVNRRGDDARRLGRRASRARHRRSAAGEAGLLVDPPRPVHRAARLRAKARSRSRISGAQLAAPLLRTQDGHARARCLRGAGRQDDAHRRARRRRPVALDSDAARLARVRDNLARLRVGAARMRRGRRRRRRARRVVGRPAVRPHPGRRSLHGVGHRASTPGWQMAAARVGHRGIRAPAAAAAGRALAVPGAWWALLYATCSVFREENEHQITAFLAKHADALRETLTFPAGLRIAAGNSCLRCRARATIRTAFSTRSLRKR